MGLNGGGHVLPQFLLGGSVKTLAPPMAKAQGLGCPWPPPRSLRRSARCCSRAGTARGARATLRDRLDTAARKRRTWCDDERLAWTPRVVRDGAQAAEWSPPVPLACPENPHLEKSMTTALQAAANSRNAARSSGPRTAAGKARASQNAVRHGLRSLLPVLPGEKARDWEEHQAGILRSLTPLGA